MSKVVAVVLFLALVGVACSSDPLTSMRNKLVSHFQLRETLKTKQTADCSVPLDYPEECVTASTNFFNLISNDPSLENINLDDLNAALNELCTSECIGPEVDYYECIGDQDLADLLNTGYCGQSSGRNCFVLWVDGVNSGSVVPISTCVTSETCDSSCQDSLQTTANYLGCCAASFYNNPESPFYYFISPTEFATCNVTLGEMCEGVSSHAGINRVGFGLLTVFVAVAAIINAVI